MKTFHIGLFIVIFIVLYLLAANRDYDTTDDIANEKRSGLSLYTDHKTGCQYIKGGVFGSMIPRIDVEGHHVGCKY